MNKGINIFLSIPLLFSSSFNKDQALQKPNIILIMADDMGYECLSAYGSKSYHTPVLDSLAEKGILFSEVVSQPLCTPSRAKIMTGLYNYRNYDYFGHLNSDNPSFGNVMQEAGYSTLIAGKWQLNGLDNKDVFPYWNDNTRPNKFGFSEYCLWQLTGRGSRYVNPLIEQNGIFLENTIDDYGPDIFSDYIIDFIERKKDSPFFIYYPMVLVHPPFQPTPDSKEWADKSIWSLKDTAYFKDMVAYADKIVGRIADKLKELEIDDNTILIFTGDNGTHGSIYTHTDHGIIKGGKGSTTDAGTHVPLIIYWPEKIKNGFVYEGLIEFSDFFPTFAEIANTVVVSDGVSFLPILTGNKSITRETAFVSYNPDPIGESKGKNSGQFVRTVNYKLYRDGRFFNLTTDILEKKPLNSGELSEQEKAIRMNLVEEFKKHPDLKVK
ncbi:MAG: sulfatase-like hydrolase/transferase [Bacteroidales bacterium]|nr:sulfatase-like hydrolase/transferase [Bacteroidales bacterium]MCF8389325.1 sulfatase-like hydrolase/transferase [Bacteroidales bacterium]